MIKVGIVVASSHFFKNPFKQQPVLELHFATMLDDYFKGQDVKIDVIDLRELRRNGDAVCHKNIPLFVTEHDIFFHWIVRSGNYLEIKMVTEELRKLYPRSKHIIGGLHAVTLQEECYKTFDSIILRAPEQAMIDIINDYKNDLIKKSYDCSWNSCHLSKYPFPKRHYITRESVLEPELFKEYGELPGTCVLLSRGCPFRCAFCICRYPNITPQARSLDSIDSEFQYLKDEYGVKAINLIDEMCFHPNSKNSVKLIELIGKHKLLWRAQGRAGIGKDLLKLSKENGLLEISIGLESVVQKVLNVVNKKQTVEDVIAFINKCKEVGVKVKTCIILGLPGEPKNIVELTKKFIEDNKIDYVNISGMCPFPGSDIFNNPKHYGISEINRNWSKYGYLMNKFEDDSNDFGLPFCYKKHTVWGDSFTRDEIVNNIRDLQKYLQENKKSW